MAPQVGSRFTFALALVDDEGRSYVGEREPFRFRELPDTRTHIVVEGDTLFTLAGRYLAPLPRACGFWWAIADFQPDPVFDPTLELERGRALFVPSVRALTEVLLAREGRR